MLESLFLTFFKLEKTSELAVSGVIDRQSSPESTLRTDHSILSLTNSLLKRCFLLLKWWRFMPWFHYFYCIINLIANNNLLNKHWFSVCFFLNSFLTIIEENARCENGGKTLHIVQKINFVCNIINSETDNDVVRHNSWPLLCGFY